MSHNSKIESTDATTMTQVTISVGDRFPGYDPDNFSGLEPTIASGQFRLKVFVPNLNDEEVRMFRSGAKLIAIREGLLLYLGICFGQLS